MNNNYFKFKYTIEVDYNLVFEIGLQYVSLYM
jgi:hypothetical protein